MVEGKEFRELMLQVVRTRMAFRRSMQRTLKKNNAGITFEMLQILSCLWHEQGITQQVLAERTAIIRKTKCFDFWERNVLFPQTKRSFFRTPTLPFSA